MDGRIDALSRMVDRLLEERSSSAATVSRGVGYDLGVGAGAGVDGLNVQTGMPPAAAGWAKKRRLDEEWDDGTADTNRPEGDAAVIRLEAGPPRVKVEAGDVATRGGALEAQPKNENGGGRDATAVLVKPELSEGTATYGFPAAVGTAGSTAVLEEEVIIGGGALCRDSSFLRDLDNMSIGSVGSMMGGGGSGGGGGGSLGPLQLIDVTSNDDDDNTRAGGNNAGLDVMNESFFDIDFEAEITSMPGSDKTDLGDDQQQQQPSEGDPAATQASSDKTTVFTTSPAVAVAAVAAAAAATAAPPALTPTSAAGAVASLSPPSPPETPEIAMPLASAALGAFMVHYATAKAVKEPANAAAAVAMDTSRHALERTASLR